MNILYNSLDTCRYVITIKSCDSIKIVSEYVFLTVFSFFFYIACGLQVILLWHCMITVISRNSVKFSED